jgi:hypothetical protein
VSNVHRERVRNQGVDHWRGAVHAVHVEGNQQVTDWIVKYDGLSKLGRENTPDYRGYVVRVVDGEPAIWFAYAYDQDDAHTYWIGKSDTEAGARALLERLVSDGWLCEIFVNGTQGHCTDRAVMVKHTWYERKAERLRTLLCERHGHVFDDWSQMTIREYVNVYNGLVQDAPILGDRIAPQK